MEFKSNLEKILKEGKFAITTEVAPPKGINRKDIEEKAEIVRNYADAVNITDNQRAVVRLSSFSSCIILLNIGVEPIMQMTCRDRNRVALQSDLLGANASGIKNVLCLTGDHQSLGNHPFAKNVYDIDSIQELAMFKRMMIEGKDESGDLLNPPPSVFLGAVENPFADPLEFRALRLAKKIKAGAEFIQTQAVYDIERFEKFMELVRDRKLDEKCFILGGIVPLKSSKAAKFVKEKVSGMSIDNNIIERLEKSTDPKKEGIKIAIETIKQLKTIKGIRGIHLMAIAWEEKVPEIIIESGLTKKERGLS